MTPKQIIEAIKAERPEINTLFFVGCGASSAEQYPARTRQCPAGFICHTAGMHDQDLHDSVSRPTVRH